VTYVFAVDVGSGTQDVLLADADLRHPDLKIVLPAPTQLYAAKIRRLRRDLFCDGYTMGGGAIVGALRRHAERHRVIMTPAAARTVRDDPEQVRKMGIEIGEESDLPAVDKGHLRVVDKGHLRVGHGTGSHPRRPTRLRLRQPQVALLRKP